MSIMKNINYLSEMNVQGCSTPDIFVIVKTGFQSAAPALLSLLTPGCTDIVKMKLGISPWHRRGIRSLIKSAQPPFALEANKFLYKIGYFTAERGLYYLMVADIATEFVTTWQSLAFVAEQCELPSAGTAYGYFLPFVYSEHTEYGLGIAPIHNVTGMAVGPSNFDIFPGFQSSIAWSVDFDSYPTRGLGVNVLTWMTLEEDGEPFGLMRTNDPASKPKNSAAWHFSADTLHDFTRKRYYLHVKNDGDVKAQVVGGTYSIKMSGHPTGVLPWGCKFKKVSIPFT